MVDYSERRKRRSAPKVRLTVQNNHAVRAPDLIHDETIGDVSAASFTAGMIGLTDFAQLLITPTHFSLSIHSIAAWGRYESADYRRAV